MLAKFLVEHSEGNQPFSAGGDIKSDLEDAVCHVERIQLSYGRAKWRVVKRGICWSAERLSVCQEEMHSTVSV